MADGGSSGSDRGGGVIGLHCDWNVCLASTYKYFGKIYCFHLHKHYRRRGEEVNNVALYQSTLRPVPNIFLIIIYEHQNEKNEQNQDKIKSRVSNPQPPTNTLLNIENFKDENMFFI
jgi:hypothetical protein